MGGQQVGKTAISGWRDLLTQAHSDPNLDIKIGSFSPSLSELCKPGVSIVERLITLIFILTSDYPSPPPIGSANAVAQTVKPLQTFSFLGV